MGLQVPPEGLPLDPVWFLCVSIDHLERIMIAKMGPWDRKHLNDIIQQVRAKDRNDKPTVIYTFDRAPDLQYIRAFVESEVPFKWVPGVGLRIDIDSQRIQHVSKRLLRLL